MLYERSILDDPFELHFSNHVSDVIEKKIPFIVKKEIQFQQRITTPSGQADLESYEVDDSIPDMMSSSSTSLRKHLHNYISTEITANITESKRESFIHNSMKHCTNT
jgi:uncharacterized membrane protein YheB (UPF0754 family)